jgi:hypothetical protein
VAVVATSCSRALQQHRGLTATGKTAPAGLTSRRSPV